MTNKEIIQTYFVRFFSGKARHTQVREFLTDDFTFRGPLMSANNADEYIDRLSQMGDELEIYADVCNIVAEGHAVAALVDFHGPVGNMRYAQWFTMRDGKIAELEVIYDPRPFLQGNDND
ncbi:MAG: hypothetical protein GF313_12705 [Caldithrix sp.]|nr:hypothetical protein [Caldithrix sp.]